MNIKINNKEVFNNPIMPGFYPDPSICRVGEEYYMINSSFAFFPGIPIFKSTDLVNWEQIGHVLDRESQLNLDGAGYSGGIFASTIRYHEGLFYIITTNMSNGGNFIVTAKNPKGSWSDPYWIKDADGIDPSLFFDDDGKVYYTGTRTSENPEYMGDHEIWLQEIDLNYMKLKGKSHILWKGALKNASFVEGPHLYKINGYYYLIISEGGTEHYHSVTIARSKEILGTYEGNPGNPILTHRHLGKGYPISSAGHVDLVETQNGEWYMVALASRPYGGYYKNLGRETFLIPVIWEDEWPIVSPGTGKIEFTYQMPNLSTSFINETEIRDDFDKEVLDYKWNTIRTPKEQFWSLKERPGFLRLKVRTIGMLDTLSPPPFGPFTNFKKEGNNESPSFIGRRQQHINFKASTKMEFKPQNEYETGGIALIQNDNHQFRLEASIEDGQKVIRLIKCIANINLDFRTATFNYENIESELVHKTFSSDLVYLKVTAKGQEYNFYYGSAPDEMELLAGNIDGRILSSEVAGGFVGTYVGLFASSNGNESENVADFDWFDYQGQE
ncbi:Non-reducing end alpha-L-arabinofuranosidase BoGH43B precursor [Clostridium puniceum]|uniref:Non-reducing end alpha-L-arabinofuranosidase BoGH43B n=1 Tax=Clostridium puniceum TaxID=29367 RepID=A0A1S8SXN7_9CLOT|nr:glycoside hydrolase family 43 protein [Clostridium puniceum]OOM70183.1 Non-reducing end alpha-L-arabinofuranosidase BoGH43B precursor [Clostridium puniceum]